MPFVLKGHHWTYNLDRRAANITHAVWTDNRDVRPPPPGKTWADYTPPVSPFSKTLPPQSLFDPNQLRPLCVPQPDGFTTAGMRNQNLYTSRLTEGLVASSPQNTKPLGFGVLPDGETVLLQRAFVVNVQNTGTTLKTFRLTIRNQPPDPPTGKASFLQFPEPGLPDPLTELFVNVGPKSSATRNVFVTSTDRDASIVVDVEEATAPGGDVIPPESGGLLDTVVLNPDITNPDITNPDITNPDITNPDITNAEVYNPDITNPDITNPDITNPDITNPDITNPDITNPDITNPDITNVQVMNPDITNPDITNPDITNPDITNPDITNPDITNAPPGSYTDSTWTVKDNGNTSASYKVKLLKDEPLPDSFKAQLLLHRGYSTPVAVNCDLALQRQSILAGQHPEPRLRGPAHDRHHEPGHHQPRHHQRDVLRGARRRLGPGHAPAVRRGPDRRHHGGGRARGHHARDRLPVREHDRSRAGQPDAADRGALEPDRVHAAADERDRGRAARAGGHRAGARRHGRGGAGRPGHARARQQPDERDPHRQHGAPRTRSASPPSRTWPWTGRARATCCARRPATWIRRSRRPSPSPAPDRGRSPSPTPTTTARVPSAGRSTTRTAPPA